MMPTKFESAYLSISIVCIDIFEVNNRLEPNIYLRIICKHISPFAVLNMKMSYAEKKKCYRNVQCLFMKMRVNDRFSTPLNAHHFERFNLCKFFVKSAGTYHSTSLQNPSTCKLFLHLASIPYAQCFVIEISAFLQLK